MFDKIVFISDHTATIKLKDSENITMNLMNLHLVFEDDTKKVLGEVNDIDGDTVSASFLGEIVGNRFLGGTIRKPKLDSRIRVINKDEIVLITGKDERGYMALGNTPFYDGIPVYLDVNNFFSSHFAIMGNSGSGKSCGITRLFQNMFHDKKLNPCNANIIMFDSSGEYYNAFNNLSSINQNYNYRFISTNEKTPGSEKLRIPVYLLNEDDLALLLQVTTHSQLPIIERMRKLALVFSQKDVDATDYKNHLIAKAIMTILYTNETAPNKRNEIFSVLASCSTPQFNLEAVIQGLGYTRKFRECFLIDNSGNFTESVLLTEYVSSFINDRLDNYEPEAGAFYTLDTLEKALNFTLISEGWLRNKNTYGDAVTLKVRLHSLVVSGNAKFFDVKENLNVQQYLESLVNCNGKKYQFVNINLDDVDDVFAKVLTKIFSRLIFSFSKSLTERASMPFHIVIEEAHRYIQNDTDRFLLGYNIFERIAKEGRKYGVILGIITQRPVELSDTVISQCSNFLIFKMNHPVDVEYIRKMVPNISDEIVEKQKNLQAGTCLGFGGAFRIPMIVRMEMPNPAPWSGNCDVVSFWGGGSANSNMIAPPVASLNSSVIESEGAVPVMTSLPSAMNSEVMESVASVSEPQLQTGEFNLLGSSNSQEEIKVPTEAGVNLVNLVDSNNSNMTATTQNSMVTNSLNLTSGNDMQGFSGENTLDFNKSTQNIPSPGENDIPTLVSFNTETVDNTVNTNNPNLGFSNNIMDNAMNTNLALASPTEFSGNDNLVSFANENQTPSLNSVGVPTGAVTNIDDTDDKDDGDDDFSFPAEIDFVSTSKEINDFNGIASSNAPSLVKFNTGETFQQSNNLETLPKSNNLNDTFAKPDFSGFNTGGHMMDVSAVSLMGDSDFGNGQPAINVPKDMNFNGNGSNDVEEPISFSAGSSLVDFLDQL